MFDYFKEKGYLVIYKRATNKEKEFTSLVVPPFVLARID
jgi:hypothetical protein